MHFDATVVSSEGRPRVLGRHQQCCSWKKIEFLVDTGADCTVFSAATLARLRLPRMDAQDGVSGLGGLTHSVIVETQIRLTRGDSGKVLFRGRYAAVTGLDALDISVLESTEFSPNFQVVI